MNEEVSLAGFYMQRDNNTLGLFGHRRRVDTRRDFLVDRKLYFLWLSHVTLSAHNFIRPRSLFPTHHSSRSHVLETLYTSTHHQR